MATYYLSATDSRFRMPTGPYTIEQLVELAKGMRSPFKFFDENGFLKGTVYPNGEVQR